MTILKLRYCFVNFVIFFSCVLSENDFKSVPVIVKSFETDTVLLPCYLHDTDEAEVRVRWYKDGSLLADSRDAHHLLPDRFRMWTNYSLQVDNLHPPDTGDYTCEVLRQKPWGPIKQVHSIEVQSYRSLMDRHPRRHLLWTVAPIIKTIPENGFLEVKKGDYVDIGCEVTGTPSPIITWRKNGEVMALLDQRSRIRFKAEHYMLAGHYECVAQNGVGDPVKGSIQVLIQDAPVVTAMRGFVHTAVGQRASLAATLEFSVPPARTHWFRDGRPVNTDDRVIIMVQDKVHQLIFRNVRKADLGNYTFRAENKLGMADVSFKLTAVPNVASFKVDPALNKATSTSFALIWEVDSYSAIIEYNLWLRPYLGRPSNAENDGFTTEQQNAWRKIIVPGDINDGPIHSATYSVRGLTPSTVYEAIVTSRNRFGWSKPSAVLHFATEPGAHHTKPSTSDYSEVLTPILEEILSAQSYNSSKLQDSERVHSNGGTRGGANAKVIGAILLFLTVYITVANLENHNIK